MGGGVNLALAQFHTLRRRRFSATLQPGSALQRALLLPERGLLCKTFLSIAAAMVFKRCLAVHLDAARIPAERILLAFLVFAPRWRIDAAQAMACWSRPLATLPMHDIHTLYAID